MNIRRRTKNIITALLAMVLCLTGFLPLFGMQTVRAEEKEAKIWFKDSEDNADSGKATFVSDKGGIVYASSGNDGLSTIFAPANSIRLAYTSVV